MGSSEFSLAGKTEIWRESWEGGSHLYPGLIHNRLRIPPRYTSFHDSLWSAARGRDTILGGHLPLPTYRAVLSLVPPDFSTNKISSHSWSFLVTGLQEQQLWLAGWRFSFWYWTWGVPPCMTASAYDREKSWSQEKFPENKNTRGGCSCRVQSFKI